MNSRYLTTVLVMVFASATATVIVVLQEPIESHDHPFVDMNYRTTPPHEDGGEGPVDRVVDGYGLDFGPGRPVSHGKPTKPDGTRPGAGTNRYRIDDVNDFYDFSLARFSDAERPRRWRLPSKSSASRTAFSDDAKKFVRSNPEPFRHGTAKSKRSVDIAPVTNTTEPANRTVETQTTPMSNITSTSMDPIEKLKKTNIRIGMQYMIVGPRIVTTDLFARNPNTFSDPEQE